VRIIVFSDSHGNYEALRRVVQKHEGDAGIFLHLGDGEREFDRIREKFPHLEMHGVSGNCDWSSLTRTREILWAEGKKIFYTHGHIFHVKSGLGELRASAAALGADVAVFGHTHTALTEYEDGLYLLNPGSISGGASSTSGAAGNASYGILDITGAGLAANIVRL
jgi:putative phosphoesterase